MKKPFINFLFSIVMLPLSIAYGQTIPSPGGFGVSTEWLYMLPSSDDLYFVVSGFNPAGPIDVCRISNDLTWHSGYRVELDYAFCNCLNDVRVRWTHFPSFSNSKTVQGEFLQPLNVFTPLLANEVSVKDTFDFQYLEALVGWKAIDCAYNLTLQGGIQYASLEFKEDDFIIFDNGQLTATSNYKSCLWGVGPEISAYFHYGFSKCFGLTAQGFTSLLVSKREAKSSFFIANSVPPDVFFTIKNTDYWTLVPLTDIRFGFNFATPFKLNCFGFSGCINLDVEVGYEATWVFNGINRLVAVPQNNTGFDRLSTFSLHGPYVHMGISY